MNRRLALSFGVAALLSSMSASGQVPAAAPALAERFVDPVNGLSLQEAIARARDQEPALRAARSQIDVAQALRTQASLRPNPSVLFERRDEPGGTDNQTTVEVEWPLDLFRRSGRIGVAEREIATAQLGVADRERVLAADVRTRYGDVLAAVRDLALYDELVAATRRQHDLLRSRVSAGASPPLERDLLDVEVRRLESERLLQAGRADASVFELKRALGMQAGASLTLRDTLADLVQRESDAAAPAQEAAAGIDQRSDVREAEARIKVADAKIDRAEGEGRFDVSLFANYMRMDAGFPQNAIAPEGGLVPIRGVFHYVSAGATVTIPILNRNQGEIAAARAERLGAAAAYEATRLTADAELAAARARDDYARQAVALFSGGARTLARQNLSVVVQSYELGRVTVFDVLAEQRRFLDVERAFTEALRAAFEARTALNRALGESR